MYWLLRLWGGALWGRGQPWQPRWATAPARAKEKEAQEKGRRLVWEIWLLAAIGCLCAVVGMWPGEDEG